MLGESKVNKNAGIFLDVPDQSRSGLSVTLLAIELFTAQHIQHLIVNRSYE